MDMPTAEVSDDEIANLADLLARLEPGFLPFKIFHQIARLVTMPIVELVPLRVMDRGNVQVLLLKREADDPVWPNQLHVPGTVIRSSDTSGSFADPLQRVITKELAGTRTSEPTFVKSILHHSGRGMEASQIFWVEVQGEPREGTFYDADALPPNIVRSQLDFIPDAVADFKARKARGSKSVLTNDNASV